MKNNYRRLRRRRRRMVMKIALLLSLILLLIILLCNINNIKNILSNVYIWKDRTIIVIDPGHGGDDPGANHGDIYEKDINLSVAKKVESLLQDSDYKVIMTRDKDEAVDLKKRAMIANDKEADVFISIHCNDLKNGQADGIETYYYSDEETNSVKLAKVIQNQLVIDTGAKDRGTRTADLSVIRNTTMPAVLTEIGFLSDENEQEKLLSEDYQEKVAEAIANGLTNYLNEIEQEE